MLTLSDYFPEDTEYFYSYPVGDTFYFYNNGDPVNEELISARLLVPAGEKIKVVVYHSTKKDNLLDLLRRHSDISFILEEKIIFLPSSIKEDILGTKRNELITKALMNQASHGNLIMAQPIVDERLTKHYKMDPKFIIWLNDKKNLDQYVSNDLLPERYAVFTNGKEFHNSKIKITLPCVVKISASASGEGIRFCTDEKELKKAKTDFKNIAGTLYIEKLIPYVDNLGFQFGIPFNKARPPHIIGYNHQVTAKDGEFLGGFILKREKKDEAIEKVKHIIEKQILPKMQDMGWYGVGGFDVLFDKEGKFYIIDSNFRTTGMTAYIFLTRNKLISKSMVSFTATFNGTEKEFTDKVLSLNKGEGKILTIVSLTKKGNEYRFNSALLFDKKDELPNLATKLTKLGVKSEVLEMLKVGVK